MGKLVSLMTYKAKSIPVQSLESEILGRVFLEITGNHKETNLWYEQGGKKRVIPVK